MILFSYYPEFMRKELLQSRKGQLALTFPAGYSKKMPGKMLWELLVNLDDKGFVTFTNPNNGLVMEFVNYLNSLGLEYRLFSII